MLGPQVLVSMHLVVIMCIKQETLKIKALRDCLVRHCHPADAFPGKHCHRMWSAGGSSYYQLLGSNRKTVLAPPSSF